MDTRFVSDKHLSFHCDIDPGHGSLNFVRDIHPYFALFFSQVWLFPFTGFLVMADTRFVSDKRLTIDCDLELGRGNLNFVRDISSHFALSSCEVWLNSIYRLLSYDWHKICNVRTDGRTDGQTVRFLNATRSSFGDIKTKDGFPFYRILTCWQAKEDTDQVARTLKQRHFSKPFSTFWGQVLHLKIQYNLAKQWSSIHSW